MKRWAMGLLMLIGMGFGLVCLAANFDGDGRGDIAYFRPGSGLWAVRNITRLYFGGAGDVLIPGDYNGNGTDRAAYFRASKNLWAVRDVTRVYFGSGDSPQVGDYNRDGIDDFGYFRPSSGLWAVRGITRVYFGSLNDVAIAPGKARTRGVTWTGQTHVYQPGDDGTHQAGAPFRYELLYFIPWDWVTVDHKTGLMWAHDGNWAGCNWGQQTNWDEAIDWCNNLVFAGYDDWRLPNVKELQSIVNYGTNSPAIDTTYFINTKSDYYWSSTTNDGNTSYAWDVDFNYGYV